MPKLARSHVIHLTQAPLRAGLLASIFALSAFALTGCGRSNPNHIDGGFDGGPDGGVLCQNLDRERCLEEPGCDYYSGCPSCDGRDPGGSCGPAGAVGGACPAIACLVCEQLDEASCR